ncbi:hypothetical protein [Actinoplanes sp. NPDC048796]|uniref:hypothetical protein n=1 Tax=unclassified Actinoplanes TaxID=2626549 RepID=UPI0033F687BD
MIDERESRGPLLTAVVIGLGGLLLAAAALTVASPAITVGLLPDWLADHDAAQLTMRIAGWVVIVVVVLCLVVAARWTASHIAGRMPARSTVVKGLAGSAVVAFWLLCVALPMIADRDPGLLRDAAPQTFGDYSSIDRTMLLSGLLALGLPLLAALVAGVRYRARGTAGVLVVLVLVIFFPVVTSVRNGVNHLQDERRHHRTECVYFVGGYDCPGD